MTNSAFLRAGDSGPLLEGSPGEVLTAQVDGTVKFAAGGGGVLRATVALAPSTTAFTFAPGQPGPVRDVIGEIGSFSTLHVGDRLFIWPPNSLVGGFHSGAPAPEYGGLYEILTKPDDQTLTVQRSARLATSAQIDATSLIAVDSGTGAGVYQVATPAGAVVDTDPQVMPYVSAVPPDTGIYDLQAQNGALVWVLAP